MTDNTVYTVVSDNDRPGTANSNGFFEKNAVLPNTPGASIDNTTYAVDDTVNGNVAGNGTGSFYEKNTIYESLLLDSAGNAGTALPLMDATLAAIGVATKWSREDHVHPTDTSRAPTADPVFTGSGVKINATTASTSTTTGSLTVAGGAGVGGSLNVGGVVNAETLSSSYQINGQTSVDINEGLTVLYGYDAPVGSSVQRIWLADTTGYPAGFFLGNWESYSTGFGAYQGSIYDTGWEVGGYFKPFSVATTASAANAFLDATARNSLLRSTSSLRYKANVTGIPQARLDALSALRGIEYNSTASADDPATRFLGYAAEEVAAIDPSFVHWGYLDTDYEEVETGVVNGGKKLTKHKLKAGAVKIPDGVQYERILLAKIEALEKRIDALTRPASPHVNPQGN